MIYYLDSVITFLFFLIQVACDALAQAALVINSNSNLPSHLIYICGEVPNLRIISYHAGSRLTRQRQHYHC